ncbi:MAG TPA: D-2-hydroxyacid dehydrogenase [Bryobacteraceae bacterium]|nr:D-2-hydroxyacid dehydrogenase [Bryobacteraceae bacterium]
MDHDTVLVLAKPTEPQLAKLAELPSETSIAVGTTPEAFQQTADDATVIFSWGFSRDLLRRVLGMSPRVRWIHTRSAGLDTLLSPELIESPAVLTNGSGVFSQSLGEWVVAAMLYFAKDLGRLVRSRMAGKWDPFDVVEISGKTVGIIGYGDIGRAVANRARALGMRVLGVTRRGPLLYHMDPVVTQIFSPQDRIRMIEQCDYVVVTAPLTGETRGMIGEAEFAAMKPGAVIINVGRGPVIDEAAMVRALTEKRIKGAALDVFDHEPLPEGHPLYRLDNVLLSPHCADHTPDWLEAAMRFFLDNFERYRKGEPLLNVVDKQLGY